MELETTIKEQAAAAVEFALSNLYEAAIEGTYQCLEMEGVKTEDFTYEQQQSIERIVMELIDEPIMTPLLLLILLVVVGEFLGTPMLIIVGLMALPILLGVSGFIITLLLLILYTLKGTQ